MARILVNIIGGQTQPNILLAKEINHKVGSIDQLVLVFSAFTKVQFERIKEACEELGASVIPVEVIEDDIIDIQNKLSHKMRIEDEDEIYVNITGGTKIMSIGVYDFFEKYSAKILYVVLGKNTYHQVFPRVKNKTSEFSYALNLEEYFTGYGVAISNIKSIHSLSKPEDKTQHFFEIARRFGTKEWEKIDLIRRGFDGKTYRGKSISRGEGSSNDEIELREQIFSFLDEIGFQYDKAQTLSKSETKYLTGDWFEEYVYGQLKTILKLDPTHWGTGLQIKIANNGSEVSNELDLAIMLRNELHIIECKTRFTTTDGSSILTETLYKTDSLRTKFGLNVKCFLFTLASSEDVAKGIPRGKLNEITIVSLDQIQDTVQLAQLFHK